MIKKVPWTPFATRLSGSEKETQMCISRNLQWKKKRTSVYLFTFIVVVLLGCIVLVSCQTGHEEASCGQTDEPFFTCYRSDFETEPYTGVRVFSKDDRTLIYEDGPENVVESLVSFRYYCQNMLFFDELLKKTGGEALRISVENEKENAKEGLYFEKVILHQLATLTEEDFKTGNVYFSDEDYIRHLLDDLNEKAEKYELIEYTVVYVDLSWQWAEKALAMGPQFDNGRYERLYLLGKTDVEKGWELYECYTDFT